MTQNVLGAVIQVVLALIASGVAVKLLTLRQDRRKIEGEASTNEANAASTLSGAALQMVQAAQNSASAAEVRAVNAQTAAAAARSEADDLWKELNKARWKIYLMEMREDVLEGILGRAGIELPPRPAPPEFPMFPPPDDMPRMRQ